MAWSYTKASSTISNIDGNYQALWTNAWTVEEVTPTQAGYIRLKVTVTTSNFYSSSPSYAWYSTDTTSYGGTSITIHARSQVTAGYTYTAYVQVPQSWSGKTVSFAIAWTTVSTTLGATGVSKSTVSASNGTFGQGIPITMTNPVSGVKHTVTVTCGGNTETLLSNSSAMSVTWTPALATYGPLITDAASATATITCETFYGTTSMGTMQKEITVSFAASDVAPTVATGWATAAPLNTGMDAALNGIWVQGYSKARVTFDDGKVTLMHGASIAKYTVSYSGTDTDVTPPATTGDTAVISATSASIVCTVTDSRGFTASETLTVTLQAYAIPGLTDITVRRSNSDGTANDDGNYIAVKATAVISSLDGHNTSVIRAFVRTLSGSFPATGETVADNTLTVLAATYSPDTSYEVKLEITDLVGNTAAVTQLLPTRAWAMKFRADGGGVRFGAAPQITNQHAMELGPNWVLALYDGNGNTVTLSYSELVALKALLT